MCKVLQRMHIAVSPPRSQESCSLTASSLAPCFCSALRSEPGGAGDRPSIPPDPCLSLTHGIYYILLPCFVVDRVPASRPHTLSQLWSLPDLVPPHLFFPSFCSFLLLLFPFSLSFDFPPLLGLHARTHTNTYTYKALSQLDHLFLALAHISF